MVIINLLILRTLSISIKVSEWKMQDFVAMKCKGIVDI